MCYNFFMRIFLIGKTHATRAFADYFTQNSKNIVFSTLENTPAEFVDIAPNNTAELKKFAQVNKLSLIVLCDLETITSDIAKTFNEAGLSVFAPEGDSLKIINSRIWAKKFIYRNKITTPRFQFFERPQAALDYIRQNRFPMVIKPDVPSELGIRTVETFAAAKTAVEEFFNTGSKKILTEEYISGKEFRVYAICDGYNPVILGDCAVYQNSILKFEADFIDENDKCTVLNDIIIPLVSTLTRENGEYIGILGFDFIKTKDKIQLLGCNPFFKDSDAELMIKGVDENWQELMETALSGILCSKYHDIKTSDNHVVATCFFEQGEKIIVTTSAKTFNAAKERLIEEGADKKEFEEALKVWKY